MTFRDSLRERAAGLEARLVFPEGDDSRIIEAAAELERLGIAKPVLLNGPVPVRNDDSTLVSIAELLRLRRPQAVRDGLHALELAAEPLRHAAGMVALGGADGCVAGAVVPTGDVARAALWLIGLSDGVQSLSAAMYHQLPSGRLLTFTDIAVVPMPTAEQLAGSAVAAADDRRNLVGDEPVVAFLSYSTLGSADGPDVERVRAAVAIFRERRPEIACDGELQFDAAVDVTVAARKCPGSPVAGAANVLVFPSLDSANIGYKMTERLGGASAAGPLLQGVARPMSDLSRGASTDDIVDVGAMVALQSQTAQSNSPQEQ